jgi:hypothetical protein
MAGSTTVRTADDPGRRVVRKIAPEELTSFDVVAAYPERTEQAEHRLRQRATTRWSRRDTRPGPAGRKRAADLRSSGRKASRPSWTPH